MLNTRKVGFALTLLGGIGLVSALPAQAQTHDAFSFNTTGNNIAPPLNSGTGAAGDAQYGYVDGDTSEHGFEFKVNPGYQIGITQLGVLRSTARFNTDSETATIFDESAPGSNFNPPPNSNKTTDQYGYNEFTSIGNNNNASQVSFVYQNPTTGGPTDSAPDLLNPGTYIIVGYGFHNNNPYYEVPVTSQYAPLEDTAGGAISFTHQEYDDPAGGLQYPRLMGTANTTGGVASFRYTVTMSPTPEPSSLASLTLGMLGIGGLALIARKRYAAKGL